LAREFLYRSRQIRPMARDNLANEFAEAIEQQTKNIRPQNMNPGYFVYATIVAHQKREGEELSINGFGVPYQTFSVNSWSQ